jgi:hypothetical protein
MTDYEFIPGETEKTVAQKTAEVLLAVGWLAFFILLAVTPVIVWAVWKALL